MATVKVGLFDTEDELSNRRVVDMSERMHRLQPDEQQFRVMLTQIGSKEAVREIVEWLEDEYLPRTSAQAASAASGDTAITVTSGDGNTVFRNGHVVRNMENGEGYLVTSTSANSIGVTRSWGGTAAASSTSVAKLLIVGNASAQGASSGASHIVQKVRAFNYVQDQRDPLFFSDFETAIELYGGREPGEELTKKAVEHGRAIENSLFFGARDFNASASPGPMGSSGGALEFISTNITDASGALTPAEFDTFLEGPYGYGSKNKAFFCAPRVGTVLSQMLRDAWQPDTVGERRFGAKVDAFISGTYGWTIPVFVKREWADFDKTGTNYGTYGFLVDMDHARLRTLRGLNTQLRRNIQEPSSTAVVHEYRTAFSLEFGWEKMHGILKGVTSYSAS
ncbi:MAG: DUF5309 family protein [Betaproteobacteria bacterium]|nr:DUF5309 family protein [Betaproteobacteria bacterium]